MENDKDKGGNPILYKMFKWINEKSVFPKEDVESTREEFTNPLSLEKWIAMNFKS